MKVPRYQALILFLLLVVQVGNGSAAQSLLPIATIRDLSSEEAAREVPVHVRGVVTLPLWNGSSWFVVQDESAGICVNIAEACRLGIWRGDHSTLARLRQGMEVNIEGVSYSGGFAPVILPQKLHIIGEKKLPEARAMVRKEFFEGCDDCQLISNVRGVVQAVKRLGRGWVLSISAPPEPSFTAELSSNVVAKPYRLVDAEICMQGVGCSLFNSRGEFAGPRLLLSQPGDLVVERPAPPSPFDSPKVKLSQLFPFSPKPLAPQRVLTEGVVTYTQPNGSFYIQDSNCAVRVEPLSRQSWQLGDRVQVAGFVDMERSVAGLIGAAIRKLGTGNLPKAANVDPTRILSIVTGAALTGQIATPSDFDGHLVTFRGRLLDVRAAPNSSPPACQLTIKDKGGTMTEVLLRQGNPYALNFLQVGSELQVTGIAELMYSEYRENRIFNPLMPSGMAVLLRDANDVTVLQAAPWWTASRLIGLLVFGMVVLAGVLLWVWQLRSQLARRSKQLAVEMRARRDAVLEFEATFRERNRLAANLHDTLLQTISGLNYQLMACETESLPSTDRKVNHLATARRMVQRAQDDLRGTVWALRVLPLHGRSFAEAIRLLADGLAEGRHVKIEVTVEDKLPRLPEFVAGNLLLLAQEAMQNAIKHARGTRIEMHVFMASDHQHITLVVRDDGVGFKPAIQACANTRHFGLAGMRERAERLGGKLQLESEEGRGTTVCAEVPLKRFDEEFEDSDYENSHPFALG